jgi:osmotically-inducible protein OsmY
MTHFMNEALAATLASLSAGALGFFLTYGVASLSTYEIRTAAAAPFRADAEPHDPDDSIRFAVLRALAAESGPLRASVDVEVVGGVVTLTGTSDNPVLRDRAVEAALGVQGVRAIVNRIYLRPGRGSAAEIEREVEEALAADPATAGSSIEVEVAPGVLLLRGNAATEVVATRAERIARAVSGTSRVRRELQILDRTRRSDASLERSVLDRMDRAEWERRHAIEVKVEAGTVFLSGRVDTAVERKQAIGMAWSAGAESVDADALVITWWNRPGPQRVNANRSVEVLDDVGKAPVPSSDHAILRLAYAALVRDPYVDHTSIELRIEDGTMQISGSVDAAFELQRAAEIVSRVPGVRNVSNRLKLRPRGSR